MKLNPVIEIKKVNDFLVSTVVEKDAKICSLQDELMVNKKSNFRLDSQNNTVPASVTRNCSQLLVQLRQQSSQQVKEMKSHLADKNNMITKLRLENRALMDLVHTDNVIYLESQLCMSPVSSSDTD